MGDGVIRVVRVEVVRFLGVQDPHVAGGPVLGDGDVLGGDIGEVVGVAVVAEQHAAVVEGPYVGQLALLPEGLHVLVGGLLPGLNTDTLRFDGINFALYFLQLFLLGSRRQCGVLSCGLILRLQRVDIRKVFRQFVEILLGQRHFLAIIVHAHDGLVVLIIKCRDIGARILWVVHFIPLIRL